MNRVDPIFLESFIDLFLLIGLKDEVPHGKSRSFRLERSATTLWYLQYCGPSGSRLHLGFAE
jgi:hypothetical protein